MPFAIQLELLSPGCTLADKIMAGLSEISIKSLFSVIVKQ